MPMTLTLMMFCEEKGLTGAEIDSHGVLVSSGEDPDIFKKLIDRSSFACFFDGVAKFDPCFCKRRIREGIFCQARCYLMEDFIGFVFSDKSFGKFEIVVIFNAVHNAFKSKRASPWNRKSSGNTRTKGGF